MNNLQPLDALPIGAIYLFTVLMALLAVELGYRLGRYWQRRSPQEKAEGLVSSLEGATLALLAFLLVFLVGIASGRFDNRRQLIIDEANAIGTTYLRAGYLNEPDATAIRQLLREYVGNRVAIGDPSRQAEARTRSEEIHTQLWARAEAVAMARPDSPLVALFIQSLNEVIDLHAKRIAAISLRIPMEIWLAIIVVAFLTMTLVGFHNGLAGRRNLIPVMILVLVFAAVILLLADLDRPYEGFFTISQQPLLDLQQQLNH